MRLQADLDAEPLGNDRDLLNASLRLMNAPLHPQRHNRRHDRALTHAPWSDNETMMRDVACRLLESVEVEGSVRLLGLSSLVEVVQQDLFDSTPTDTSPPARSSCRRIRRRSGRSPVVMSFTTAAAEAGWRESSMTCSLSVSRHRTARRARFTGWSIADAALHPGSTAQVGASSAS